MPPGLTIVIPTRDRCAVVEGLGRRRTRYLTGLYLAVRARKPEAPS